MTNKFLFIIASIITTINIISSCEKPEHTTSINEAQILKTKQVLTGTIVLNSVMTVNGADVTYYSKGIPTKFNFNFTANNMLNIQIKDFAIGAMPYNIKLAINCNLSAPNGIDKQIYKEDDWVMFTGENGQYILTPTKFGQELNIINKNNASVEGAVNLTTHQIQLVIKFDNAECNVKMQKIDNSKLLNFDKEVAEYIKETEKFKAEHNLN